MLYLHIHGYEALYLMLHVGGLPGVGFVANAKGEIPIGFKLMKHKVLFGKILLCQVF